MGYVGRRLSQHSSERVWTGAKQSRKGSLASSSMALYVTSNTAQAAVLRRLGGVDRRAWQRRVRLRGSGDREGEDEHLVGGRGKLLLGECG